ncbi:MAG: WhiB family transcriptional regulator [bacterium]
MSEEYNSSELGLSNEAADIRDRALLIGGTAILNVLKAELFAAKQALEAEQNAITEDERQASIAKRKEMFEKDNHEYSKEEAWKLKAECFGMDTNIFFPTNDNKTIKIAKKVCASCSVKEECVEYGKLNGNGVGVWGGETESELRYRNRTRKD